jgi:alpha-L-fucosidase
MVFQLTGAALSLSTADSLLASTLKGEADQAGGTHERALAQPTPQQRAWQDLEMGMFVHFAPNTWQDLESDDLSTPLSKINPAKLDTDQWVATAQAAGARYVVFVAKHQGGFCMWQTHTTDYGIRNTPWKNGKGDVLADIATSCRKHGVPLGVYVSPRDDHFGAATGGICKTPQLQKRYDEMYREQLTEVFSRYGELVEIWFDGSTKTPVGDLLRKYQPRAMVFQGPQATIRWVGNEDGFAPYPCWNGIDGAEARSGTATALDGDANGDTWLPNEVDVSIRRPNWFWSTTNANKVLTLDQLLSIYYRSVGRGAQLLLNIPANRDGLLSKPDCEVAGAFGKEIKRRFGTSIAETRGNGRTIVLPLQKPMRVDTVILQEDTKLGERVRAYTLDGQVNGQWKRLATGSAIGQKRIQPVPGETVSALRLVADESVGVPALRRFAAFDTQTSPPQDWNAASELWSAHLAGKWTNSRFSIDLSKSISIAGQYALRFKPTQGVVKRVSDVNLTLGGVSNSALVKVSRVRPDVIVLDITGLDKSMVISGNIEGADAGSILLERR